MTNPPARRAPFVLLLIGLVVGGMCALLALNTASAANEVDRHALAARDQNVAAQLVQLTNQQRDSAAPANLAAAAEQLGMVPQGPPGFLQINHSGAVRVKGSAAPATEPPPPLPAPTRHHGTTTKKTAKKTTKKTSGKAANKKTAKSTKKSAKKTSKTKKSAKKTAKQGGTSGHGTQQHHQKHQKKHQKKKHKKDGAPNE